MTKTVEIALTAVAGLIGGLILAGIIAFVAWAARKRRDAIRLHGNLSTGPALSLVQSVGCPCLVLTVTNRAKRVAKIKSATLSLRNADVVEQFHEGFGQRLGLTTGSGLATLGYGLLPITKPTSPQGWALERDDVCKFILPLLIPGLGIFHDAPSQDLSVEVEFFDDSKHEILRGDEILQAIRTFVEMYRDHRYQLNPQIEIPISLRVKSTTLPDPSLFGTTNPKAIAIQPPPKG